MTPPPPASRSWDDVPAGEPVPCANHPDRETRVRCSNCGKPICPDCMVYSAVGIKCRECARLPRSALVTLKPERAVRAVLAALGAGTAVGFAYYFLLSTAGFLYFLFFLGAGIGYLVGEAVVRASGHYRGVETALIAVGGTVWAFLGPPVLTSLVLSGLRWNAVIFTVSRGSVTTWLVMAVAGYFAWQRNR